MGRFLLFALIIILLTACDGNRAGAARTTTATAAPTATPTIGAFATVGSMTTPTAAHVDAAYPAGCTPAEVEAFLNHFFDAFNQGDLTALKTFFPTEAVGRNLAHFTGEQFVWYSMTDQRPDGDKRHFVAYDLPTLWAYFKERHERHETLHLASVHVGPQTATTATLIVDLYRTADDLSDAGPLSNQASGKGEVNCRNRTILRLSLAQGCLPTPIPGQQMAHYLEFDPRSPLPKPVPVP